MARKCSVPLANIAGKTLLSEADRAISLATEHAWNLRESDGHWCGEVMSNATITAEQVFFFQIIGANPIPDGEQYQRYLLSLQKSDGAWSLAPNYPSDLSVSVEAYLALKILGMAPDAPEMRQARGFIRRAGGAAKVRIFTRIFFAEFGLLPWDAVPQLPAELVLVPSQFPINIYKLASWARVTIVPLLIITHHQPVYALPNGKSSTNTFLDELWLDPKDKMVSYGPSLLEPSQHDPFTFFFGAVDKVLYYLNGLRGFPLRRYALNQCVQWILKHQDPTGDMGGIASPMHSMFLALTLEGYTLKDEPLRLGMEAIERFTWHDENGKRFQACVSPVWDTVLMARALCDTGINTQDERLRQAVKWVKHRQLLEPKGDWRVYKPNICPGGFSFQYHNTLYPDLDDTAAAILAFISQCPEAVDSATVANAAAWICGMQNSDGGWGAYDFDNNKLYLNKIPFGDLDALCDPSTADVTGRILEAFGLLIQTAQREHVGTNIFGGISTTCDRAIAYLARTQESTGAWFGRWGSNYIYGTSNVLCGLGYFAEENCQVQDMVSSATSWLKQIQNADGGWGESLLSYKDPWRAGCGPSTPSQTAWALMALLTTCTPDDDVVEEGVARLIRTQTDIRENGASWPETEHTGTGFPNHFYIGYALYRHYFPMMALGRYVKAVTSAGKEQNGNEGIDDTSDGIVFIEGENGIK